MLKLLNFEYFHGIGEKNCKESNRGKTGVYACGLVTQYT